MRLMAVSTDKKTDLILSELKAILPVHIEFIFHMGRVGSDFRASSIRRIRPDDTASRFAFDREYFNNISLRWSEDVAFSKSLHDFVDHLYRSNSDNALKSNPIQYIHESFDYFYIAIDYIHGLISELEIDHILFFNIPHLAYDTLVYEVAKFMGIKTTILNQSLFENKFFSMSRVDNYGGPLLADASNELIPYRISKSEKRDLFYMKGIGGGKSSGVLDFKQFLFLFLNLIINDPLVIFSPVRFINYFKRAGKIVAKFPAWKRPFSRFMNKNTMDYLDELLSLTNEKIKIKDRYVYFPLQLQPEMTTSAIGGHYLDQALAIERLSDILPNDVKIYVKENPKQGSYMRGQLFFYRLKRLGNVEFVPDFFDSHDLIDNSLFVAVVTGTAGWEAITRGKPALVFGNPWYGSMPGVVRYNSKTTFSEILDITIQHDELEISVARLLSRMHTGVVDRHYSKIVSNFNSGENIKSVANQILQLIDGKLQYTFG
jgi:Capsule polysaccharide biosynthesis protein